MSPLCRSVAAEPDNNEHCDCGVVNMEYKIPLFTSNYKLCDPLRTKSANSSMLIKCLLALLLLFNESFYFVHGGEHERRLLKDLLDNYQILERPVQNESHPIMVNFGVTLQQVIDVDEKNQLIITNTWLKMEWEDSNLRWNPADYGGIHTLRIAPDRVWRPDILMYNSADDKFDGTFHTNVVVKYNGSCTYLPPGIFKSTCKIDITWFPFDDQFCDLKFGSWTYQSNSLDLRLNNASGDLSTYIPNGEWVLLSLPGTRNELKYDCCPDAYIDVTFRVGLRRRTLYYGFNLIVPSVIISSMTLLSFTLPPDSGEKLTLGVTILLSMIVFLMQLAEIMPATSDSVSIIGTYFACIMVMVAFSVVMTVVVLNFHHRTTEQQQEMPPWIRIIICTWLPKILRMKRPSDLFEGRKPHDEGMPIWDQPNAANPVRPLHNIPSPLYNGIYPVPASPTYLELAILTSRIREYEMICHQRGCPSANSNVSCTMARPSALNTGAPNTAGSTLMGNHAPHTIGNNVHSNRFGCTNTIGNDIRSTTKCPYAFTSYPPPPIHSHHFGTDCSMPEGETTGLGSSNRHRQTPSTQQQGYMFSMLDSADQATTATYVRGDANSNTNGPGMTNVNQSTGNHFDEMGNQCCCCCCTGTGAAQSQSFFCEIMQEMRFITNRYRREDDLSDIIGEWKFAAIVIDRLCLILFSTFAVISTAVCLLSAPHLMA